MASIEESIYSLLTNDAGVSALVSTRVYPVRLPQKPTYPCITYSIVSGEEYPAMNVNVDTSSVRVQVSAWDNTYSGCKSLSTVIKSAIDRNTGTTASIEWKGSYKESEVDLFEPDIDIFQKAMDFRIFFN